MNSVDCHCRDWPNKWFGYFLTETDDGLTQDLPPITDFVDPNWDHPKKSEILNYLRHCFHGGLPISPSKCKCPFCNQMVPRAAWHWDGEWHWPASLIHYVEAHHVRLPDGLIKRMERNNWNPPSSVLHVPYEQLPMPAAPKIQRRGIRDWLKERL
jgi:hypothetical protein